MFSKFSSIIQHAVDALAPQLSLQEEFVHHWKAITSFFIDNKGEKIPVEQTNLGAHVEQMLVLLQREAEGGDGGSYGPCLEYLLQHKLLDTLYSLGRTDYPPGMKQIVLSFFTRLLSRVRQPLLAHVNVYRAVQRLIKTCGEVKAGPTEIEEIQFLCTVCAKIKADPYLVNFFLEAPKSTSSVSSPPGEGLNSEDKLQQDFPLVKTLLALSNSEDSRVAVKACEGLMLCSSLPDPVAAHCLLNSTQFCHDLTRRLINTYRRLPSQVNPIDLEHVQAKWGLEVVTQREDEGAFPGRRQLVSFLSWLDYLDQLSSIANPIVAEALARNIHQHFLTTMFKPDLMQMSETGCITATAYMNRCLRTVCSQRLLSELVLFLLGDDRKPETPADSGDSLCARLIQRCSGVSEEMSLVTLQLFDTLLQKDDEHIVHNLVLRNLEARAYYNPPAKTKSSRITDTKSSTQCQNNIVIDSSNNNVCQSSTVEYDTDSKSDSKNHNSPSESQKTTESLSDKCSEIQEPDRTDKSCLNEDTDKGDDKPRDGLNESMEGDAPDIEQKVGIPGIEISPFSTPQHVKTEVHKVVNSFLTLLPEELKSSYQTADSGYDMYLKDANKQFSAMLESCKSWGYPADPTCTPSDGAQSAQFYEGAFLKMVLDRLTHLLDQSYPINLQLTSVISRLALVPHPCLHEFLLDPFLSMQPGTRNLYTVFLKISNEIKAQFSSEPNLGMHLVRVRKKLMGTGSTLQKVDSESRLEAIIVFEEFCKELSAIAFVKHHAAVTQDK
ncbi:FHF complex subunit HOOK interacting protein 2A-like isoform X2 [Mya arenaria]|uniref:FHF complex subunit HOOK interacting protein 2A-like isoform X2 n=1 Tax=Mya arenaria TaxID=6604 RepID=UPI0022E7AB3F|nr:FHF complex subunit HOOK interacting protein 2A-like isoform X2 [Mya arenaria]